MGCYDPALQGEFSFNPKCLIATYSFKDDFLQSKSWSMANFKAKCAVWFLASNISKHCDGT